MSSERTFSATEDEGLLYKKLVELAEMLSTDMQKEGLCGRTLTLKLKTASFEVRNRAVTLQKYICSSEDILKNATKLLKAELPISLRLMGLRMSQFNEDKVGAPSDPTQKTLTNYIISGDASRKNMDDQSSLLSDISDHHFMNDTEAGFPIDTHETCYFDSRDPLDSKHLSDLQNNNCSLSENAGAMEKLHEPSSNETASKVITPNTEEYTQKSQTKVSHLLKADFPSFSGQFEGSSVDRVNKRINLPDDEAVSSSSQNEQFLWVNDYKCLLCGTELPPSFVEERQEHSDFHLAERLQKEESCTDTRNHMLQKRFVKKGHIASQSKRKKQKSSPKEGRHLPIDLFFVKSNQNF